MNIFKNIKSPEVLQEIDVYEFLDRIQNPAASIKFEVEYARQIRVFDKNKYDHVKKNLPCFTLNFTFDNNKRNENIIAPTGFIYLDVDGTTDIDLNNKYIFASWLSLSAEGRGLLVKVDGLNLNNFKKTYEEISTLLNIKSDINANKATQYCVHSYDPNLYINDDSKTFICKEELNNTPILLTTKIEKKRVSNKVGEEGVIRYNNISDYEFKDADYIVFWEEKELICEAFTKKHIKYGRREACVSTYAHQLVALNNNIAKDQLLFHLNDYNLRCCKPPLEQKEIMKIVEYKSSLENPEPIANKERRFFFNPNKTFTREEKYKIIGNIVGKVRVKRTKEKLWNAIISWDFNLHGRITQQKLIVQKVLSKNTIEKYYKEFKEKINELNELYLQKMN